MSVKCGNPVYFSSGVRKIRRAGGEPRQTPILFRKTNVQMIYFLCFVFISTTHLCRDKYCISSLSEDKDEVIERLRESFDEKMEKLRDAIEHGKHIPEEVLQKVCECSNKIYYIIGMNWSENKL